MNVRNFAMVLAIVAMSAGSAFAQGDFFWSTSGLGAGASNSDADITGAVGDTGTLFLWYTTSGDAGELDTGAGLDLSFSSNGIVEFTAAETFDFDVALAGNEDVVLGTRWGDAFGPATEVLGDAITGLNAFTVVAGDGIINANNGSGAFIDLGFDADADAFLFGSIDYTFVGEGETSLDTVAGSIGIVHNGATVNPVFGGATFSTGSAIPEPTSAGLLALGLVGLVARRRR